MDDQVVFSHFLCYKEDGSVADPAFYDSAAFGDIEGLEGDVPCGQYESYMAPIRELAERMIYRRDVVFSAIVDVPQGDTHGCEGSGAELEGCLEYLAMGDDDSKGQRYAELVRLFYTAGSISSIHSSDFSGGMHRFAHQVLDAFERDAIQYQLPWDPATQTSRCTMGVEFRYKIDDDLGCPAALGIDPGNIYREVLDEPSGSGKAVRVICPVPRLPAPLDCGSAQALYPSSSAKIGWVYCENLHEDNHSACSDGLDNDCDGATDCDDAECNACTNCGGLSVGCQFGQYFAHLTELTRGILGDKNYSIKYYCPNQKEVEDMNCLVQSPRCWS
ncbi:MAG: hypothetical protein QNJ97_07565 [Myxococcota bacterium]|nr:hypothetical protein [Myxococcota bacterium]